MNRFKNHLIAAAVFSVLAIIGTIMNSHQAAAQGPPNGLAVNVVNSIPLQATVSGNVGITGTPNVNVANPATAPVLALNVNDPGRIPYQSVVLANCSTRECVASFPAVPANHRLVIQHFAGVISFISGGPSNVIATVQSGDGSLAGSVVTATAPTSNGLETVFDLPVLLYSDAGQVPMAFVEGANVSKPSITLTGYMLDCTIAPCAPIAH
jgi:hypothetical protein